MIKISNKIQYKGIIGVCGAGILDEKNYLIAVALGEAIAKENYIVICGGLGGTMEAVCKGAKSEGGFTIGILPSLSKQNANNNIDLIIPTGMGEARNIIIASTAEGIITISGGAGTLTEIAFAWRFKKPIVCLTITGGWSQKLSGKQIDPTRDDKIIAAIDPYQAVNLLITQIDRIKNENRSVRY